MNSGSIIATTVQVAYPVTVQSIRAQLSELALASDYKDVVKAIAKCRDLRGEIEARRKFLKQDSLEYGRLVDRVASELSACVVGFEEPLRQRKQAADDAKAQAKAAKEAEERAARDAELTAAREAADAAAREQRQREEAQLAERRAEVQRLREEAQKEAEEQRAALYAERSRAAAEKAEAQEAARVAREELRQLMAAREADATRARLAAEAEENRKQREKHEAELAAKVAAAEPDLFKLAEMATAIDAVPILDCVDTDARDLVNYVSAKLDELSEALRSFDGTGTGHV